MTNDETSSSSNNKVNERRCTQSKKRNDKLKGIKKKKKIKNQNQIQIRYTSINIYKNCCTVPSIFRKKRAETIRN
jgi:hypothetical protein